METNDEEYIEGKKYKINNNYYFIIFENDIRFFNNDTLLKFEINTYPHNPRDILKYFNFF